MSSSTLVLDVTHSKRPLVFREVRFQPDWTLEHVKKKLEVVTGTLHSDFLIEVYDDRGQKVGEMVDDQQATLGSFPIRSNYRLHVVDHREQDDSEDRIWREEEAEEVPKYQVPEESYAQREVSGRKFREEMLQAKASHSTNIELHVGDRCFVAPNNRVATVRYVGKLPVHEAETVFVGVQFDEPVGKNDGSYQGHYYFHCEPGYGSFVPLNRITKMETIHSESENNTFEEL
ncbi:hypothetical protein GAYE_SCF55G6282 [Galdieria yellowstonensis]|uniref:CAP-Gly domain-containing protein n=1 Tax=Galdieria yellowstonensis TaxID=3028027 RepID=A0AAV9ILI3_9RHOD|nr:hypothetical protein GAYE_SCF55G6282 [Galdieria yellowstonensis]